MNNVVAVVVTFKRKDLLLQVLDSLLTQTEVPSKILVIDNNSGDGTEEAVTSLSLSHDNIVYQNTGANLGGAGGFHFGFEAAKAYDYSHLWLMDDDFQPAQDCLEKMLALQHTGIVQPIRFNLDGSCAELSPVTYNLSSPFIFNPKTQSVLDIYEKSEIQQRQELDGIPFEGPLISKEVVDKVGLPEAKFFIFYDDLDYAIRTRKAGYKIICSPDIKATRLLMNNQGDDLLSWKGYFMLRNLFYVHKVHGDNVFVKLKPVLLALGYAAVSALKGQFKQVKIVFQAWKDSSDLSNTEKHKP